MPLVHKIANRYKGYDTTELFNNGLYGLSLAIDSYDEEAKKHGLSELNYFAKYIDGCIKQYIADYSRLIRIPRSQTKGDFYKKQNNLSLNDLLNKDSNYNDEDDTEENDDFKYKDKLKYIDSKYTDENIDFVNDTWEMIFKSMNNDLGEKTTNIIKSYYGIGCEPLKGKELAKKYGYKSPSSITAEIVKAQKYLTKKFKNRLKDLKELYNESLNEEKEAN